MTGAPASLWESANLVAALVAIDPNCGGVVLRAGPGPARDAWLAILRDLLPAGGPFRRVTPGIGEEMLTGGLDLVATLRTGRPVNSRGVLADAEGGVVVLAMAERLTPATAARIAAAMDCGETARAGDGGRARGKFRVVALDEGDGADERPPAAIIDRLTFCVGLEEIGWREVAARFHQAREIDAARAGLAAVEAAPSAVEALVAAAAHLGVPSLRAPLQALRVARALCALRGANVVDTQDLQTAAQLVLAPRATQVPASEMQSDVDSEAEPDEEPQPNDPSEDADVPDDQSDEGASAAPLDDVVLAAAAAALPPGLLARLATSAGPGKAGQERSAQGQKASARRGRPAATRRGALRDGRIALVDTLCAAVPWQKLRRREKEQRRIIVKPEDFRIVRYRARPEQTAIFVVDASGSSAAQRLSEVKGAIELLLVDCYVRRESVALVAFRGNTAEVILPPTRSLARAKRTLSSLPGGGGTPLALGLDVALTLADSLRRKGRSPLLVLMTDGKANVARDGAPGRVRALDDALDAAKSVRAAGIATFAIDTAPASQTALESTTLRLGQAMNARYIRLPVVDATQVSQAVRAAAPAS